MTGKNEQSTNDNSSKYEVDPQAKSVKREAVEKMIHKAKAYDAMIDEIDKLGDTEILETKDNNSPSDEGFKCGNCETPLIQGQKYCGGCGAKLEWDR